MPPQQEGTFAATQTHHQHNFLACRIKMI